MSLAQSSPYPILSGLTTPLITQYNMSTSTDLADNEVIVGHDHFCQALAELIPSISEDELSHYQAVQDKFSTSG